VPFEERPDARVVPAGGFLKDGDEDAERFTPEQYVEWKVSGVFFAPLEFEADPGRAIAEFWRALKAALPVVLLDRRPEAVPNGAGRIWWGSTIGRRDTWRRNI
jgi:hypothetical protein